MIWGWKNQSLRGLPSRSFMLARLDRAAKLLHGHLQLDAQCCVVHCVRRWRVSRRRGRHRVQAVHARWLLSRWLNHRQAVRLRHVWQRDWTHVAGRLPDLPHRPRLLSRRDDTDAVRSRQRRAKPGSIELHSVRRWLVPGRPGRRQLRRVHARWLLHGGIRRADAVPARKLHGGARQHQRVRMPALPIWPRMPTGRHCAQGVRRWLSRSE